MRILHTSDWHLGQYFYGKSRKQEHLKFIDWLIELIKTKHIDLVVIAGDIYDTGTPPSYARELYNRLIVAIHGANCSLVVIGGNHDSVATLEESQSLVSVLNTSVIASIHGDLEQQVIHIPSKNDQDDGALICAVPYLRPQELYRSQAEQSALEKQMELAQAIKSHYQKIYQIAKEKQAAHLNQTGHYLPIIATGHLTALGVSTSESVRDIYIGHLEAFDANLFPAFDYIALGHIHRSQVVAKNEKIRYSGSPICLSFDESPTNKQVLIIDFEPASQPDLNHHTHIESVLVPCFQPIASLTSSLDDLNEKIEQLCTHWSEILAQENQLSVGNQLNETKENKTKIWCRLAIESQDYLSDLQGLVEEKLQDYPIEILQLKRLSKANESSLMASQQQTLAELNVMDVFEKRLMLEHFDSPKLAQQKQQMIDIFQQILIEVETASSDENR